MDTKALLQELKDLGLPEKAATVYCALVDMGHAYPSKIAEVTKLNRSTVYKTLSDLVQRGLITELEKGKKLSYQIEKPLQLVRFIERQKMSAEQRLERARAILPQLETLFSASPNRPSVRFFEGVEGILALYEEHVLEHAPYEMLSYSNVDALMPTLPARFVRQYIKQKQRLHITTRAILPDTRTARDYNADFYRDIQKRAHVQSRFIPAADFPYTGDITLYGSNKLSIINFHEGECIGVAIEDAMIAGMMRMIFELAWRSAEEPRRTRAT